jgi:sirohydrochlorin cobaltochelatase
MDFKMTHAQRGILLFAHGSRNPAWAAHFERLRDEVRKSAPQVSLCYLELCAPDFAAGVAHLIGAGCTEIKVIPIFLAPGKHTEQDLPELVVEAQRVHAGVRFEVEPTLLESGAMLALMVEHIAGSAR